jgi:hypothetical protein
MEEDIREIRAGQMQFWSALVYTLSLAWGV